MILSAPNIDSKTSIPIKEAHMKRSMLFSYLIISICLILPAVMVVADDTDCPLRIVILGDRTGGHVPGIFGDIVAEVELMKPDLVLMVGDMIEGYVDDRERIVREWEVFDSLIAPLSMPIYFTAGNHDIWSDLSEEIYRERNVEPYYSIDFRDVHIVFFDNSRISTEDPPDDEQLNWLVNDLKRHHDAEYTMVFIHKPFWFENVDEGKPDTLHSIFKTYGVDAVFTGHYHEYFVGEYDGITYTGIGSSGAKVDPGPTGLQYHYAWVTIDDSDISIAIIKKGSVLAWDELTASERKEAQRLSLTAVTQRSPVVYDEKMKMIDEGVVIIVDNVTDGLFIRDSLRWKIPDGWVVNPASFPVEIDTGSRASTFFRLANKGALYPVPEYSINLPYTDDKSFTITRPLLIARTANCIAVDSTPAIDGVLSEEFWSDPITRLFSWDGGESTIDPVSFYFAYDAENLYLAAQCHESNPDSIIASVKEHDGTIYSEDCVGYFLQPDLDTAIVYQIYINPLGTVFDQLITINAKGYPHGDRDWNGEYEIKTECGDNSWIVEARIPLAQFKVAGESGKNWRLNFRRKQKRLNSSGDWQVPIEYNPETYGTLIFK